MKTLLFVAASALALTAAACAPSKVHLRTALDCPVNQGELTRTSQAPDGKTCTYRSSEGADVTLQLVPVKGDPVATLQGIENAIAPPASRSAAAGTASDVADAATDAADGARDAADAAKDAALAAGDAARDAADAAREAAQDAGRTASATVSIGGKAAKAEADKPAKDADWDAGAGDKVDIQIDKSGHKIVADNDTAQIDLPGIHISAKNDDANVRIGGIRINANEDSSTVHIIRDVRMRGEALSRTKRGIRATFISANHGGADGFRFVGYEASGPKTGPLTVAVVKAKTEIARDDEVARDVQRLVRRNGGA